MQARNIAGKRTPKLKKKKKKRRTGHREGGARTTSLKENLTHAVLEASFWKRVP